MLSFVEQDRPRYAGEPKCKNVPVNSVCQANWTAQLSTAKEEFSWGFCDFFCFCKVNFENFWVTFKRYLALFAFLRKSKNWLTKVANIVVSKLNPGNQEQFYRPCFDFWHMIKKIKQQLAIWRNFLEKSSFFIKQGKPRF